jgi:predicted lactoylglutathione lyase
MRLPAPVPELPVSDINAAVDAYARQMGFTFNWKYEDSLAGIWRDDTRLFLRKRTPEEERARYTIVIWLNMASSNEVAQLHDEWEKTGVRIVAPLQTAPYNLREFTAEDLDGNRLRVFFDLGGGTLP